LRFEESKSTFVTALYKQRGKHARNLIHTGMAVLSGVGMMIAPVIAQEFPGTSVNPWEVPTNPEVLSATTESGAIETLVSEKVRDSIKEYIVEEGDTIASVAKKFGVDSETIKWQNNLTGDKIKVGQSLQILPVIGIAHKVSKGDTVYSIAKKYDSSAQAVVDFPFNTFSNDETFALNVIDGVINQVSATIFSLTDEDPVYGVVARDVTFKELSLVMKGAEPRNSIMVDV